MMTEPVLVSVPALSAWVRERVGPGECQRCRGRLAWVCVSCEGEGSRECDMGHEHMCDSCRGVGFYKCELCKPKVEWEEIPRPLVRLCGVDVGAWDLLDQLSSIRSLVVQAQREGDLLHLRTRSAKYMLAPPDRCEPYKSQPLLDYPIEQLVLPLARA